MLLAPGQILNTRYRVIKLIGQGGFGAVYRAWDTNLNGPCAIKENFDASPAAQDQFKREASILFNLRHPNLPRVFDSFSVEERGRYLVMDYIEGVDLAQIMERIGGPLPEEQAVAWIVQVCDALNYLHSQNPPVIHRDIKPTNIRITPTGQAILVDFGIAKVYDPKLRTTIGARAVSPGYSPPEQYGSGITDERSDVYALGATLYALLAHQEPVESVQRTCGMSLVDLRSVNPAVNPHTEMGILRAMKTVPAERFASISEFKEALQQGALLKDIVNSVSPAKVTSALLHKPAEGSELSSRRSPWVIWVAALLLVFTTLIAFLIGFSSSIRTAFAIQATGTISSPPAETLLPGGALISTTLPVIGQAPQTLFPSATCTPSATPLAGLHTSPLDPPATLPAMSPTATLLPSSTPDCTAKVKAYNFYRTGPGFGYPSLGFVKEGTVLKVLGKDIGSAWLAVEFIGRQAWIASEAVDFPCGISNLTVIPAPPLPTNTPKPERKTPDDNGNGRKPAPNPPPLKG